MRFTTKLLGRILCALLGRSSWPAPSRRPRRRNEGLKLALVQVAFKPTLEGNRDVIIAGIGDAAAKGARVAVFPEGALNARGGDSESQVADAVAEIRRATRTHGIYVVMGGVNHSSALKKRVNWMKVIAPDGREVFHYDKLYNHRRAPMPGVFEIDGVPCGGMKSPPAQVHQARHHRDRRELGSSEARLRLPRQAPGMDLLAARSRRNAATSPMQR